ncbi:MAG: DHH family phosphoesterase [Solibacillus isronensis]
MEAFFNSLPKYEHVYIQGHDHPDTDSLASSFLMQKMLQHLNVKSTIIYNGPKIDKPILNAMISQLGINVERREQPHSLSDDELLIVVDSQYGGRNITKHEAQNIACFDHHAYESDWESQGYAYVDIQPKLGSCVTLLHEYAKAINLEYDADLACAMLLGLYIDTNNLTANTTDLDRTLSKELNPIVDQNQLTKILRTSYTQKDVEAINECLNCRFHIGSTVISFIRDYDNNLVGQLSDFLCEIEGVENVILVSTREDSYRISVRSYSSIPANTIIQTLTKDIGGGGGNSVKAAGFVSLEGFKNKYGHKPFQSYLLDTIAYSLTDIKYIEYLKDDLFDHVSRSEFFYARKKRYSVRYLDLQELFPNEQGYCSIETIEGLVQVPLTEVLILGVKGEIYPISKDLFNMVYERSTEKNQMAMCDNYLDISGIVVIKGEIRYTLSRKLLLDLPVAYTTDSGEVLASLSEEPIAIKGKYGQLVSPDGAYIIMRSDGEFYLCDKEVFNLTYREVEEEEVRNPLLVQMKEGVINV